MKNDISDLVESIMKDQGIPIGDPGDAEKGVDLFLHDHMQKDTRSRNTILGKIRADLSRQGENSL